MIKKLRFQFILITMLCISFIFILILIVINLSMNISSRNRGFALLSRIADIQIQHPHDPELPEPAPERSRRNPFLVPPDFSIGGLDTFRSFSVLYDQEGTPLQLHYNKDSDMDQESILQLANRVMQKQTTSDRGVISEYLFLIREHDQGRQIFFLDYSLEKNLSLRLVRICLCIGLVGILFIFIPVFFLSHWITKPVQMAFDRQKQFIADASHELKTPLTIITTNAEVLEGSMGENKWLQHILFQTRRMNILIKNLLDLARLDSYDKAISFSDFDMSKAVKNAALSFESLAFEYRKTYRIDIAPNLFLHGDENAIRQLVTILLDNAFKYSDDEGFISLFLYSQGDKKVLRIENSGPGIPPEDQPYIFERFYRSDTSRSRSSGSYGLGLSIAASIAKIHRGQLHVSSDGTSYTCFTLSI